MRSGDVTWKQLLLNQMQFCSETWDDLISITLSEQELETTFDNGFGGTNGIPFTAWTTKRVYFPVCYDGAEWVGSVSRNPDGKATDHIGG